MIQPVPFFKRVSRWFAGIMRSSALGKQKKPFLIQDQAHKKDSNLHDLSELTDSLQEISRKYEPKFLETGKNLQEIHGQADKLTKLMKNTSLDISGGTDEGALSEIGRLAEDALETLKTRQKEIVGNLNQVNVIMGNLEELQEMCSEIEKIAMILRVVGLNIGIESTRSQKSKEMFQIISIEIRKLSDSIKDTADRIRKDTQKAKSIQKSAHTEIASALKQLDSVSRDAEKAVEHSIDGIENLLELSNRTLEAAGTHSGNIAGNIADIVVGIQFHDSMNQRISHISEAIHHLDLDGKELREKRKKNEVMETFGSVLSLQIAHLREVASEVREIHEDASGSFSDIEDSVDQLVEKLSCISGIEKECEPSDREVGKNPFDMLKSAMIRLRDLMFNWNDLVGKIREPSKLVSETASSLSAHMREVRKINFDTRIKALNAIVKAANLGEKGRTLEVLAQEMKVVSDQSGDFVVLVENNISSMNEQIRLLNASVGADESEAGRNIISVDTMDSGMEKIDQVCGRYRENFSQSLELAKNLNHSVREVMKSLTFFEQLSEDIRVCIDRFSILTQEHGISIDTSSQPSLDELEKLKTRYSMHKERLVHDRHLNSDESSKSEPESQDVPKNEKKPEKSVIEEDDKEFGDNVELF